MKRPIFFHVLVIASSLLLFATAVGADDQVSAYIDGGTGVYLSGRHQSAKFEEYREVPDGAFGGVGIDYQNDQGFHFELDGAHYGEEDQQISIDAGKSGSYNLELDYNKFPHRYAYDAHSLYGGVNQDELRLDDALQTQLQNATSLSEMANILHTSEQSAFIEDIEIERKRARAAFTLEEYDPFRLSFEVKRDERKGTRPMGGSFGFGNAVEIIEPRDYETMEYRVAAEYGAKEFYAAVGYYASVFDNEQGSVLFDNPFRITDSTSPVAYLNPSGSAASFANNGAATGLIDLAPDNLANNLFLTGVIRDLPLNTQLSLQGALGWLRQDDDLKPYTTNTAIRPPVLDVPFDAADPGNLPIASADREVDTAMWNSVLSFAPLSFMDAKADYRFYEWDNESEEVVFPGAVRFDAVWEPAVIQTQPVSFKKHTAGLDLGFDVAADNRLGVLYQYQRMDRENREVNKTDDNTFGASYDLILSDTLNIKTSYDHSIRRINGSYDPTVPFQGEETIPQLPFLRKFDEADRDRDKVQVLAGFSPVDPLDVTASFIYGRSDYDSSPFGLLDDEFFFYSLDLNFTVTEQSRLYAFYSFETHESNQLDRQWNPGGVGDPFVREPGFDSNSNWSAELTDDIHTVGAGFDWALIPDRVILSVTYWLSAADGKASFDSPIGTSQNDANPFEPKDFSDIDDIIINSVNPELTFPIRKNLSVSLGYLWEKYDVGDYNKEGFTYVPRTPSGDYNGALLMWTLPYDDYEVDWAYARIKYIF